MWWRNCNNVLSRFYRIQERNGQTDRQTDGQNCYISIARLQYEWNIVICMLLCSEYISLKLEHCTRPVKLTSPRRPFCGCAHGRQLSYRKHDTSITSAAVADNCTVVSCQADTDLTFPGTTFASEVCRLRTSPLADSHPPQWSVDCPRIVGDCRKVDSWFQIQEPLFHDSFEWAHVPSKNEGQDCLYGINIVQWLTLFYRRGNLSPILFPDLEDSSKPLHKSMFSVSFSDDMHSLRVHQ